MQFTFTLGLMAVAGVMAAPAAKSVVVVHTSIVHRHGKTLSGSLGPASGTIGGSIGTVIQGGAGGNVGSGIAGSLSGSVGSTIAGGLGGSIGGIGGSLTGFIPPSGLPHGCIGGHIGTKGFTICARDAEATPAPKIGKTLSGSLGPAKGTIGGSIGTVIQGGAGGNVGSGIAGSLSGSIGSTIAGGLGGSVGPIGGFLTGYIPPSGVPHGCIGGHIGTKGYTICARDAEATPAPVAK